MMKIVATNVVASRPPERRPTATPTARAKNRLKTDLLGLLPGPVKQKTDQNPDLSRLITLYPPQTLLM